MNWEQIKDELKALLANCPEQRVYCDFLLLQGECQELCEGYEDEEDMDEDEYEYEEDRTEAYTAKSIYINENGELSFDLTLETWDFGNYWGEEKLSNVTLEFIL